jgi:hypothetical protein
MKTIHLDEVAKYYLASWLVRQSIYCIFAFFAVMMIVIGVFAAIFAILDPNSVSLLGIVGSLFFAAIVLAIAALMYLALSKAAQLNDTWVRRISKLYVTFYTLNLFALLSVPLFFEFRIEVHVLIFLLCACLVELANIAMLWRSSLPIGVRSLEPNRVLFSDTGPASPALSAALVSMGMPLEIIRHMRLGFKLGAIICFFLSTIFFSIFLVTTIQIGPKIFGFVYQNAKKGCPEPKVIHENPPRLRMHTDRADWLCQIDTINDRGHVVVAFYLLYMILTVSVAAVFRVAGKRIIVWGLRRGRRIDRRSSVLYLRSFKQDSVVLDFPKRNWLYRLVMSGLIKSSIDELLLEEGAIYGPVVALQNPGMSKQMYGPVQHPSSGDEWMCDVANLMDTAAIVFLFVEDTPGVRWEVEQLSARNLHEKCVFVRSPQTHGEEISRLMHDILADVARGLDKERNISSGSLDRSDVFGFCIVDGRILLFVSKDYDWINYQLFIRAACRLRDRPFAT